MTPGLQHWLSEQGFPSHDIHARINTTTALMHAARLGDSTNRNRWIASLHWTWPVI